MLIRVGGVWDLGRKDWSEHEPRHVWRYTVHRGQLEAARWLAKWLTAYLTGEPLPGPPIYSALLIGGSRAGKTNLAMAFLCLFTIAVPGARIWVVQEADREHADECETELDEMLPGSMFRKVEGVYRCANGTRATIRSGRHPKKLKRGRCDLAVVNEGQNIPELSHSMLRMRTSDTGGLVVTAANPPNDNPAGEWVADFLTDCEADRRPNAVAFKFDPRENPHVNRDQLEALKDEVDLRTYEIEVLGMVKPPSDASYYAFDPVENVDSVPDFGDVTGDFAARLGLGASAMHIVGADFQLYPHMAATVARCFTNPRDARDPLVYFGQEALVEHGDEYTLSEALFELGLNPATTVIVGDASAEWQRGDRKAKDPGIRGSFDILRKCGWTRVVPPDRKLKANPDVHNRWKNDNRCFATANGERLVRIDPEGCPFLLQAVKKWRTKNGRPMKGVKWAHICDAMSYVLWRLYPPRNQSKGVGYKSVRTRTRSGQLKSF